MAKKKIKHTFTFDKGLLGSNHVIIGLDMSLSHTGIVILNGDGQILHQESVIHEAKKRTKDKIKMDEHYMVVKINGSNEEVRYDITEYKDRSIDNMKRVFAVRDRVQMLIKKYGVTLASIESPSYGSSGHIVQLSEMSFASRVILREANIPYYMVSPKTMKKYIAGHGSAEKEEIQRAILLKYYLTFSDDNEADAFGLARMLLDLGEEMEHYIRSGGGDQYEKQLKKKLKEKELKNELV